MKLARVGIAMVLVCGVLGGTALAGYRFVFPVQIFGSSSVRGSVGDARASANSNEYIGCTVLGQQGSAVSATCNATDQFGKSLGCYTAEPGLVQAAASVGHATLVSFGFNTSGYCTYIYATNQSYVTPAAP